MLFVYFPQRSSASPREPFIGSCLNSWVPAFEGMTIFWMGQRVEHRLDGQENAAVAARIFDGARKRGIRFERRGRCLGMGLKHGFDVDEQSFDPREVGTCQGATQN